MTPILEDGRSESPPTLLSSPVQAPGQTAEIVSLTMSVRIFETKSPISQQSHFIRRRHRASNTRVTNHVSDRQTKRMALTCHFLHVTVRIHETILCHGTPKSPFGGLRAGSKSSFAPEIGPSTNITGSSFLNGPETCHPRARSRLDHQALYFQGSNRILCTMFDTMPADNDDGYGIWRLDPVGTSHKVFRRGLTRETSHGRRALCLDLPLPRGLFTLSPITGRYDGPDSRSIYTGLVSVYRLRHQIVGGSDRVAYDHDRVKWWIWMNAAGQIVLKAYRQDDVWIVLR